MILVTARLIVLPTADDSTTSDIFIRHECPTTDDLHAVYFLDSSSGWILTHSTGKVLATNDSGRTWAVIANLEPGFLEWITFIDAHRGWVCGANGKLMATTDGGYNWKKIGPVEPGLDFGVVHFLDERQGFAAGMRVGPRSQRFMVTDDGGKNWRRIENPDRHPRVTDALAIVDTSTVLVGGIGSVFRTTDGGNSWMLSKIGKGKVVRGLFAGFKNSAWAVGHHGLVLVSEDNGVTWRDSPPFTRTMLRGVIFMNEQQGFIFGRPDEQAQTIWRTRDAGKSWLSVDGTFPEIHRAALTAERLWMVGAGGAIYSLQR